MSADRVTVMAVTAVNVAATVPTTLAKKAQAIWTAVVPKLWHPPRAKTALLRAHTLSAPSKRLRPLLQRLLLMCQHLQL